MNRHGSAAVVAMTLSLLSGTLHAQDRGPPGATDGLLGAGRMGASAPGGWIAGSPASRRGMIEVAGFGRYTHFDQNAGCPCDRPIDALGFGGVAGVFLNRALELEADIGTARAGRAIVGGTIRHTALAARLNYNVFGTFLGARSSVLAGAGVVRTSYGPDDTPREVPPHDHRAEWGPTGLAGARFALTNRLAARVDGIAEYMPSPNSLNLSTRAGLSLLLGSLSDRPAVPVRTPAPTFPAPAPPPTRDTPAVSPPPSAAAPPAPPSGEVRLTPMDSTTLAAPIYFPFDRSTITAEAEATLRQKLPILARIPQLQLQIEGHADIRGTDQYNLELGRRRADATRMWFVDQGIDAARLQVATFGEARPVCEAREESCWRYNRRADFVPRIR